MRILISNDKNHTEVQKIMARHLRLECKLIIDDQEPLLLQLAVEGNSYKNLQELLRAGITDRRGKSGMNASEIAFLSEDKQQCHQVFLAFGTQESCVLLEGLPASGQALEDVNGDGEEIKRVQDDKLIPKLNELIQLTFKVADDLDNRASVFSSGRKCKSVGHQTPSAAIIIVTYRKTICFSC